VTPIETTALVSRSHAGGATVETVLVDPPGPGEVRVKVEATAICHSDLFSMDGEWGDYPPSVFGHETAGIVTDVGEGVDGLEPGRRVVVTLIRSCGSCYFCRRSQHTFCPTGFDLDVTTRLRTPGGDPIGQGLRVGGFAGQVVVERSQVVVVSDDVSPAVAALLGCGVITGFGAVTRTAGVEAGASVVVVGAGGVGLNSIQAARLRAADPIVAVDLVPGKREAARRFGASHAAGPDGALDLVHDLTDGRGADYVFVTAGSARAIDLGMALVRRGGALVAVGMPPDGVATEVEMGYLATDGRRILGSKMGSSVPTEDVPMLVDLYRAGHLELDALVTRTVGPEQFGEVAAEVRSGAALRNVIVFD
jgi:Zn-dependent alcohol dehydrogenase